MTFRLPANQRATLKHPPFGYNDAIANVAYGVSISNLNVTLSLTNTVPANRTDNILVGQGTSATLNASDYTLSNYSWTVGGDAFASYDVAPDSSKAHVIPLVPGTRRARIGFGRRTNW